MRVKYLLNSFIARYTFSHGAGVCWRPDCLLLIFVVNSNYLHGIFSTEQKFELFESSLVRLSYSAVIIISPAYQYHLQQTFELQKR